MVTKTSQLHPSLVRFRRVCIIGFALLSTGSHTHAQGTSVDLRQSEERVSVADGEVQNMNKGVTRLYFAFGAETIENASRSAFQSLFKQAEANPESTIIIRAYTDNRGWALGNLELSRIRARSVAIDLIASGVDVSRMKAFAFGELRPAAPNSTAEGRRFNRRVEVSLIP